MIDLAFAVFIWGLSFALAKRALNEFSPFQLVTIRLGLGALFAYVLTRFFSGKSGQPFLSWPPLVLGVFEFGGTYLLYTWSLNYLPSGVVGTLTLMTPVFTVFIGRLFKINTLNWHSLLAAGLSFCGALMCFPFTKIFGSFEMTSQTKFGICLLMLSNLLFSIGNVLISKWEGQGRWNQSLTSNGLGHGFILAMLVSLATKQTWHVHLNEWRAWILPLYLGFIATGLGFFLWNRGVQKVSAFPASLIGNFKGPLAVFWGIVLMQETFNLKFLIGLILLFYSAVMVRLHTKPMVYKSE